MTPGPGSGCTVRQSPHDPDRWFFDFDVAAPGGRGGASLKLDRGGGVASIDGVYRNRLLPKRSTGGLLADGLTQVGLPRPVVVEAYNVEKTTHAALAAGGSGQGTLMGNLLQDTVVALGGAIIRWEPVPDGSSYHLRVHVAYP